MPNEYDPYDLFGVTKQIETPHQSEYDPYDLFGVTKQTSKQNEYDPYDLFGVKQSKGYEPYKPMVEHVELNKPLIPAQQTKENIEAEKYMATTTPMEYVAKAGQSTLAGTTSAAIGLVDFFNKLYKVTNPTSYMKPQFEAVAKEKGYSDEWIQENWKKVNETFLDKPVNDVKEFAGGLRKAGLDGIAGMVFEGLGRLPIDIPKYATLGFVAPMMVEGGVEGASQALEEGKNPVWGGVKGAAIGGTQGYITKKLMGITQYLPKGTQHLGAGVLGGAVPEAGMQLLQGEDITKPENLKRIIASTITMGLIHQKTKAPVEKFSLKDIFAKDIDFIKRITKKDIAVPEENHFTIDELASAINDYVAKPEQAKAKEIPTEQVTETDVIPPIPQMKPSDKFKPIKLIDENIMLDPMTDKPNKVFRDWQNDIKATTEQGVLPDGTPYTSFQEIKRPGTRGAGTHMYESLIEDVINRGGIFKADAIASSPDSLRVMEKIANKKGYNMSQIGLNLAGQPRYQISKWETTQPKNIQIESVNGEPSATPPVTPPITPPPGGTGVPGETPPSQEPRLVESKVRSNTGEKIGIKEQLPKEEFLYPESTHPWRDEQVKQRVQSEGEQNIINRIESQGVKDEIDNVFVGEKINELKKDLSPENIDKIRSLAKRAQVFGTEAGKNVESFKQWQESFAGRVKVAEQVVAAVEKQPRLKKKMKEVEAEINALKGKVARTPNLQQKRKILTEEFRKKYPKWSASEIKAEVNKTLNPDGKTDWSSFEQAVKSKLKIPVLDDSTIKMIKEYSDKIDALPKDSIARIEWEGRLGNKIGELMPVTFKEKLALFQTMAMLLRPRSPIKNLVGNTLFEGITRIVNKVAVPIDMLFALRNKGRTLAWSTGAELKQSWIKTWVSKFAQDAKYALEGLDINNKLLEKRIKEVMTGKITDHDLNEILYKRQAMEEQGGKFELGQKQVFKSRAGKMAMATLAITMRSTDRAAFWARFENSLANQIAAGQIKKGYSGVNPNMVEQAIGEGLQVTFQNKTLGTWAALGLKRALNKYLYFGGEAFMKFVKTPLNIINQGIEHSPLGSVKAIVNTIRLMKAGKDIRTEHGILEGKAAEYGSLQRQTAIEWGRTLTGTGVMLLGYMLAKNGAMTGGEPDEEIKKLNIATGKGNRSINTSALARWLASGFQSDQLIPKPDDDIKDYDWLGPLAIPLSIGANKYQYEQIPKSKLNANQKMLKAGGDIVDMYLAAADVVAEQPMTQGLRMLTGGKKVTDIVGNLIKNVPASFIPQLASDIALLTSSTLKDVRENDSVSEAWNMMKKRIPGVSSQLPVKVTVLGQKMEIFEPKRTIFEKFWDVTTFLIKPWIAKKYKAEPGIQFVETLYRKTGEAKVLPRDVTNTSTISYQGKKIPLSQENRLRYQEITGQLFSKYVRENLEALKGMDNTDDQVAFMHEILNEVGKDARNQWLIEQGY